MLGVLTGFGIIGFVILIGYVVERIGLLPRESGVALNRVAFFVSTPALLFEVLARSHPSTVFSAPILVTVIAVVVAAGVFVLVSRIWFRRGVADTVVGAGASSYVNANNIGLPVATYVLGNPQLVAPLILLQVVVMAPIMLSILDVATSGRVSVGSILTQPLRNPIILASVAGVLLAVFGVVLPDAVMAPFELIGGSAVPLVLLAFGMSLVGQRPLQPGSARAPIIVASLIKLTVMPVAAYLVGRFVIPLTPEQLFGVVALAALPTAQNIFNYAVRYQRGVVLARDTVLLTTLGSVVVMVIVAALLAP